MRLDPLYDVRHVENLRDMLEQSSRLFGDKDAFLVKEGGGGDYRGISYRQFKNDVDALGAALADLGLSGGHVAVMGENRYEWCVSYLAAVNHIGVVVPIDKELPAPEKENLLVVSDSQAVVFSGKYAAEMQEASGKINTVRYFISMDLEEDMDGVLSFRKLIERGKRLLEAGGVDLGARVIDNRSMSILLFTSGTTGLAKGVMLSHWNICSNIMAVCRTIYADSTDMSLSILPIHHTFECTVGFLAMMYIGATVAFNEGLKHILKNFKEARPTFMVTVPLILENMYKKIWEQAAKRRGLKTVLKAAMLTGGLLYEVFGIDVRRKLFRSIHENFGGRLRLIMLGAAAIDPVVSKGFRRFGIDVLQGYGLTECSPIVTGNRSRAFRDDSIGLPLPGIELKIDKPDENGIGEIITKGDNVMQGYYNNPEATQRCIRDGWFHTGDLGRVDKNGFCYITGRLKNVIVTKNGKNIFPEEVEAYINKSPYVLESLVTGNLDSESGETSVCAHIFPDVEAIKDKLKVVSVSSEELLKFFSDVVKGVNRDMPLYKRISSYTIRDTEFVKTTTRKIKRYAHQ